MMITLATPAEPIDPLSVALTDTFGQMAYWDQPSLETAIAASGVAFALPVTDGADRFGVTADAVRELRARTTQIALDGAERAPLLIGGFSFFDTVEWEAFGAGSLVLPELAYLRRPSGSTWVAATTVDSDSVAGEIAQLLITRIESHTTTVASFASVTPDHERAVAVDLRDDAYIKAVESAIADIGQGALEKVVVARQLVVEHEPDLGRFLAALRERFSTCATFAFRRDDQVFCGATPERLVHVDGVQVLTGAVAASAPRGSDATQDEVIADRLRHDPKEKAEHGFVVSEIRRRLNEGGCVIGESAPTEIMRLPGIQHLFTPISATAPVGTDVLDIVGALHPTPAVGGLPTAAALDWIATNEPLDRGWYAGPIGFCDLAGNGEFRVALRSGIIEPDQSRLFVGAGVVGASAPERELEETSLKLGALLPSLLGS
jgi:salicylate biosynthesis isochorismate synthase/menaquinone-specific isochorismate synthase